MEKIINKGIKGEHQIVVGNTDTARAYGSGLVEVFATPAMIALMENTALQSIAWLLPDGMTSVGTEIYVNHLRATPVGHTVHCESRVVEVRGRSVVFEVTVSDEKGIIGQGKHTRFVIDTEKFMSKL
ncbi:thioesterase family protein [Bacteroidales bacterium]